MSKGITQDNMLSVLPGVLDRDEGMHDLAELIAWAVGERANQAEDPAIFQRIDELDEDLPDDPGDDLPDLDDLEEDEDDGTEE